MSASNVVLNEQESSFDLLSVSGNALVTSSSISPYAREPMSPSSREQNGEIFKVLERLAQKHDTLVRALHPQAFPRPGSKPYSGMPIISSRPLLGFPGLTWPAQA